ncbi:hypothetical protein GCM10023336_43020 [Streptomyces similanensis]|uniref:Uncharacterized protein n=1 Tax=Streptomyces similanensis TaxID=1274988 RepID=A0ABP9KTR2_9ACTN
MSVTIRESGAPAQSPVWVAGQLYGLSGRTDGHGRAWRDPDGAGAYGAFGDPALKAGEPGMVEEGTFAWPRALSRV